MISEIILKYHNPSRSDRHHRFKSWEHCYNFFKNNYHKLNDEDIFDHSSLHLAFYLASWGMLRGSSFLLQKDYKIHEYFLDNVVKNPTYCKFFNINPTTLDYQHIDGIDNLISETKKAYQDNIHHINDKPVVINVTETLTSKILLGVYGNVPAYDRYFKEALKIHGIRTQFDEMSLKELVDFYNQHYKEFEDSRNRFLDAGVSYTPMKLIDMYFWQVGFMIEETNENLDEILVFAENYKSSIKDEEHREDKAIQSYKENTITGSTDEIRKYIIERLNEAKEKGEEHLDLVSGDIHKKMGLANRMPSVCNAMETLGVSEFEIIHNTPSGKSSTKKIRYYLN